MPAMIPSLEQENDALATALAYYQASIDILIRHANATASTNVAVHCKALRESGRGILKDLKLRNRLATIDAEARDLEETEIGELQAKQLYAPSETDLSASEDVSDSDDTDESPDTAFDLDSEILDLDSGATTSVFVGRGEPHSDRNDRRAHLNHEVGLSQEQEAASDENAEDDDLAEETGGAPAARDKEGPASGGGGSERVESASIELQERHAEFEGFTHRKRKVNRTDRIVQDNNTGGSRKGGRSAKAGEDDMVEIKKYKARTEVKKYSGQSLMDKIEARIRKLSQE